MAAATLLVIAALGGVTTLLYYSERITQWLDQDLSDYSEIEDEIRADEENRP